jgi:hypothetical protein
VLKPVKPSAAPKSGDEAAKPQKDKPQQEPSANAPAQPAGAAGSVGALPSSTNNSAPTSHSLSAADPDNPERLNLGQGKPAPTLL